MELYNELRENWERLYWDEGYSKKLASDHANYESAEEDDEDFNPYRNRRSFSDQTKEQGFNRTTQGDNWEKVSQIRDKFEYDRERRMRDKAFAPMNAAPESQDVLRTNHKLYSYSGNIQCRKKFRDLIHKVHISMHNHTKANCAVLKPKEY
jgi:hypothetical protein